MWRLFVIYRTSEICVFSAVNKIGSVRRLQPQCEWSPVGLFYIKHIVYLMRATCRCCTPEPCSTESNQLPGIICGSVQEWRTNPAQTEKNTDYCNTQALWLCVLCKILQSSVLVVCNLTVETRATCQSSRRHSHRISGETTASSMISIASTIYIDTEIHGVLYNLCTLNERIAYTVSN